MLSVYKSEGLQQLTMPRDQEFTMNSVVYVILEEKAKVRSEPCAATLRDVHQTSTNFKFYEVQLLQKCAMHQEGQQVSVDESNIFRTYDECKAVCNDRKTQPFPRHVYAVESEEDYLTLLRNKEEYIDQLEAVLVTLYREELKTEPNKLVNHTNNADNSTGQPTNRGSDVESRVSKAKPAEESDIDAILRDFQIMHDGVKGNKRSSAQDPKHGDEDSKKRKLDNRTNNAENSTHQPTAKHAEPGNATGPAPAPETKPGPETEVVVQADPALAQATPPGDETAPPAEPGGATGPAPTAPEELGDEPFPALPAAAPTLPKSSNSKQNARGRGAAVPVAVVPPPKTAHKGANGWRGKGGARAGVEAGDGRNNAYIV